MVADKHFSAPLPKLFISSAEVFFLTFFHLPSSTLTASQHGHPVPYLLISSWVLLLYTMLDIPGKLYCLFVCASRKSAPAHISWSALMITKIRQ